jgi:F420-dependent oxidoreductase-like protein
MIHQQDNSASAVTARPRRDRIGVSIATTGGLTIIEMIEKAEAAGVEQVWMTQNPVTNDSLTIFAAAMERTNQIRLGTSIVPTYPRHPLALAQQAATVAALGPGRLRLGVGPSHRPTIEGTYGLPMEAPLAHLREYVGILRDILWKGQVDHQGHFFTAKTKASHSSPIPLLTSALSEGAFRLAGELSDGAISWNCPPSYLLDVALPALRAGAQAAQRPTPLLVAHAWVALSTDVVAIRASGKQRLAGYARLPFYANMFAAAGYPIEADGNVSDALIDSLVIRGDEAAITTRIDELLASGLDELLLTTLPLNDETAEREQIFNLVGRL